MEFAHQMDPVSVTVFDESHLIQVRIAQNWVPAWNWGWKFVLWKLFIIIFPYPYLHRTYFSSPLTLFWQRYWEFRLSCIRLEYCQRKKCCHWFEGNIFGSRQCPTQLSSSGLLSTQNIARKSPYSPPPFCPPKKKTPKWKVLLNSMHINKLYRLSILPSFVCQALQYIHFGIDIVDRTLELQICHILFLGKFTFYYHFGCVRTVHTMHRMHRMHRSHELSNEHESHAKQLNCQLFDGRTSEKSGHRCREGDGECGNESGGLEESKIQSKTCTMKIG